jgi:O-antigen chain-terminating methyltransferase
VTIPDDAPPRTPDIDDFLGEPTRDLEDWRWLWTADQPFPVRSHRGVAGRLIVAAKRLLRPLVRGATADLWDRQRVWNLIVLEHLSEIRRDVRQIEPRIPPLEHKTAHLEAFLKEGLQELMRYDDALYTRVDQKLDRYRRQADKLTALLGSALDRAAAPAGAAAATVGPGSAAGSPAGDEASPGGAGTGSSGGDDDRAALAAALVDRHYLELERRHRGTPEEIRERLAVYQPLLAGRRDVVDLGCGRGEALALLAEHGARPIGVDESPEMVRRCRELGLDAVVGDAVGFLSERPSESLDAVVSFHVVEHLPAATLARLIRAAWRALRPGGVLILETPNPLSIAVAASRFWRDPTHLRPLHPDALRLCCEQAGFDSVEIRGLHPFPASERLPQIDLSGLDGGGRELAHRVNLLRDRLDQALYGDQDYAAIARKA